MNEKKLIDLYKNEIENSAPDFDAMWKKIENNLEPKENTLKITPKKSPLKPFMAIAACAVCVIGVSLVFADNNPVINDSAAPAIPENTFQADEQESSEEAITPLAPMSYENLNFTSYSETFIDCSGKPNGADYFVEDMVLSSADCIIRGIVTKVYRSENGESLCYEMEVKESCPETTEKTVVVKSNSPYKMKRGREYLIPAEKTDDCYRTVFDNIPQLEFTAEGGIVYYNGWNSLDAADSVDLLYPQKNVDDFFYDRMKFSYAGDISPIIEKFRHLKAM